MIPRIILSITAIAALSACQPVAKDDSRFFASGYNRDAELAKSTSNPPPVAANPLFPHEVAAIPAAECRRPIAGGYGC
ncbi:hypothetical protein C1J03_05630 [Sulfitobacter sp. SK012]|uniref:hypothetical protein n=1 Tax=Sulfitobacter sp. SK012 TaxID=1389005 RepID=UPI000E0A10CE|nr:hypothetical protein [Sulfitobacter sp. SK012]AXI45560.1 hypothetical protein C1J03_05630 [Sulfitobacter sp. SK012]